MAYKRIKRSGEIIDVTSYCCSEWKRQDDDYVVYTDQYGIEHKAKLHYCFDLEDMEIELGKSIDPERKKIDWEARRYHIANRALIAMIAIMTNKEVYDLALVEAGEGSKCVRDVMARAACSFADSLIKELKKGGRQ